VAAGGAATACWRCNAAQASGQVDCITRSVASVLSPAARFACQRASQRCTRSACSSAAVGIGRTRR
jgi:hypothetical protein